MLVTVNLGAYALPLVVLLRTLGGLSLGGSSFRRPKPLLLLAYLAIEGPADRGRLATLFWPDYDRPRQNLAVPVSQLKAGVPGALSLDGGRLVAQVDCDSRDLVAATTAGDWRRALNVYEGHFLEGYPVDVGEELESWILDTRDYLGGMFGSLLVDGAIDRIEEGETQRALDLAERAYRLFDAGIEIEPGHLGELHSALSLLGSPHAVNLRREAEDIGVELHRDELSKSPTRRDSLAGNRLPPKPTSPFVGRERELEELRVLLTRGNRLVTVTGFSGVGKSRLALEFCHNAAARGAYERVFFVPMEPVSQAEAVFGHLATAVGFSLPPGDKLAAGLAQHLDERHTLLVLDNMEHLVSWAPRLGELVANTERLVVLATSTQPLAMQDEALFLLEGLELAPSPAEPQAADCAAVRYFEQRSRRIMPSFSAEEAIGEVWEICASVGGLPLGLELAAGLVRVLSLRELAERLERHPEQIVAVAAQLPERHRSLSGLCEHAWAFLDDAERAVLAALSVFKEGFSVADLEAICGPALADLARLERRSLVKPDGDRYTLHPLIKRFAAERLADDPTAELEARDKHAERVSKIMDGLRMPSIVKSLGHVIREAERAMSDVIGAWRWSVDRGADQNLLRLFRPMIRALNVRGRNSLAHELVSEALEVVDALSSAAARLHLALANQAIDYDVPKARNTPSRPRGPLKHRRISWHKINSCSCSYSSNRDLTTSRAHERRSVRCRGGRLRAATGRWCRPATWILPWQCPQRAATERFSS